MTEKKIPISLNKSDYNFLNYIQQGLLYSGRSMSNVLDFSDILKATILHSTLKILGSWEEYGIKMIEEFLKALGVNNFNLPKTNNEFLLSMKLNLHKSTMAEHLKRIENDSNFGHTSNGKEPEKLKEKYGTQPSGTEPMRETGVSTFILKLKDDEITLFDMLKTILEMFKKSQVSYSEMTRVLFRNTFVEVDEHDTYKQLDRFAMLSSFYIKGAYGFTAVESTLLLHNITSNPNLPKLSKDSLEKLSHIHSDETLFNIYIEEIEKIRNEDSNVKAIPKNSLRNRSGTTHRLHSINENKILDERYKSSISPSLTFHSAYIGYVLMLTEWHWGQHKLSLLTTYFSERTEDERTFAELERQLALKHFKTGFNELFNLSKQYRDNPKKFEH